LSRILAEDVDEDTDSQEVRAAFPAVADMLERPDSGIATRFTFNESAEPNSGELQTSRLIEVEVIDRRQAAAANRRQALTLNLKRYIRPAIAAAAVLLVGLALFFATPTIGAVDVGYVFKVLKDADNIHATLFDAGKTEPVGERWISRPLNKYMAKVGQELTLWDISRNSRIVKASQDATPQVVAFTQAGMALAKRRLEDLPDIKPFRNESFVPPDAKWDRVPDDALPSGTQGYEVYDLEWTAEIDTNGATMRRWRVFMDPTTDLPEKVQYFRKLPGEAEYALRHERTLEYPSDADMRADIERVFP
jgi:hypothetical protein